MVRGHYIKQESFTQQQAEKLLAAKHKVLILAGLTYEQHEDMMFEYGCQFVERAFTTRADQYRMLTESAFGFWPWWRMEWAKDDEGLIRHGSFYTKKKRHTYDHMKECMLDGEHLREQLVNMLIY